MDFSILNGQTISEVTGLEVGSDEVYIKTVEGGSYKMYHRQDCCEDVSIVDLDGDASDIVGGYVTSAEEVEGSTPADYKFSYEPESYTWTFYKINTNTGSVFIRWLGESNGYYSEDVSFIDLNKEDRYY